MFTGSELLLTQVVTDMAAECELLKVVNSLETATEARSGPIIGITPTSPGMQYLQKANQMREAPFSRS